MKEPAPLHEQSLANLPVTGRLVQSIDFGNQRSKAESVKRPCCIFECHCAAVFCQGRPARLLRNPHFRALPAFAGAPRYGAPTCLPEPHKKNSPHHNNSAAFIVLARAHRNPPRALLGGDSHEL